MILTITIPQQEYRNLVEENANLRRAIKKHADTVCEGIEDGCGHFPEDCFGCQMLKDLPEAKT